MVKVYAVNCTPLTNEEILATALTRLDATRTTQIARNRHPQKRAQKAAAGLLLNHLFGTDQQPPQLMHSSHGKPYLADNRSFFNLSHSDDWVVCAVANSELGVDAQIHTAYNEKIAARSFTHAEQRWLDEDPDGRFTRLWTYKEAYIKYTGFGLVLPLSSFTVPTPPDGWDSQNHVYWKEYTIPMDNPLHITVCCGEENFFSPLTILNIADIV